MDKENSHSGSSFSWALIQPCFRQVMLRAYLAESEEYWSKELSTAEANVPTLNLSPELPYDGDLSSLSDALVGLTTEGMRRNACNASFKLYRESCVIMLYSFIEKELHEVCRLVIEYTNTEVSLNQMGYLAGSKETLKEVCHLNWGDFDPEWGFIYSLTEGLRGLRNVYAHSSGEYSLVEREHLVKEILKKHTGKEELDFEYINLTLNHINQFFNKIRDKVWHSNAVQQKVISEQKL